MQPLDIASCMPSPAPGAAGCSGGGSNEFFKNHTKLEYANQSIDFSGNAHSSAGIRDSVLIFNSKQMLHGVTHKPLLFQVCLYSVYVSTTSDNGRFF
jgi:hypothetical protein